MTGPGHDDDDDDDDKMQMDDEITLHAFPRSPDTAGRRRFLDDIFGVSVPDEDLPCGVSNPDSWWWHMSDARSWLVYFKRKNQLGGYDSVAEETSGCEHDILHGCNHGGCMNCDHDGCPGCQESDVGKKHDAYYNAAAHARRAHFNPRKRGRKSKGEGKCDGHARCTYWDHGGCPTCGQHTYTGCQESGGDIGIGAD